MTLALLLSLPLGCSSPAASGVDTGADSGDTGLPDTGDTGAAAAPPGTPVVGTAARRTAPSNVHVAELAAANGDFGLRFLRAGYDAAPANLVVSPWSLQVVMAQVYAGAGGDAKAAIGATFGWSLPDADLHEAFDATDLALQAHNAPAADPPVAVTSTNQIFVTTGYDLGVPWLDTLSEFYGTGVQSMDFMADPAAVAADINAWIADRTGGHIDKLITEATVRNNRMLLANAIYFNVSWAVPFSEGSTADAAFTLVDGSVVTTPTMSGTVNVYGAAGPDYFVADLPYSDAGLAMTFVIPDEGRFASVLASLDWASVQALVDSEEFCEACQMKLPKFEVDSKPAVNDVLLAFGMDAAYGGDYSAINPALSLSSVEQAGFVAVNEIGTEAAAATVAEFSDSASEAPFGPVVVDRPFLWFIRDVETDAVLFAGVVVDPR